MIRVRNMVRPPRPMRCSPHLLQPGVWMEVDERFRSAYRLTPGLEWDVPVPSVPTLMMGMRVIVPYANRNGRWLRQGVIDSLQGVAEFIDVGGSETAYAELVESLWRERRDFCLIEHDVLVAPGDLAAFDDCPQPWCHSGEMSLGSVRFRAEIMRAVPDLLSCWPDHPGWVRGHWQHLDDAVHTRLAQAGFAAHAHAAAIHLGRPA